jgi:hypothetical protein
MIDGKAAPLCETVRAFAELPADGYSKPPSRNLHHLFTPNGVVPKLSKVGNKVPSV